MGLPVRRSPYDRRVFCKVSSFKFRCRVVIYRVRRFSGANQASISFQSSNMRTVAARMVWAIRIRLSTCWLVWRAFKVFVFRCLSNRARLSIRLPIRPLRRRRESFFIECSFSGNVFGCVQREAIASIIRRSNYLCNFNFAIRCGIAFKDRLYSNLTRRMRNAREILGTNVLYAKVGGEQGSCLLSTIWTLRGKVPCSIMRRPL